MICEDLSLDRILLIYISASGLSLCSIGYTCYVKLFNQTIVDSSGYYLTGRSDQNTAYLKDKPGTSLDSLKLTTSSEVSCKQNGLLRRTMLSDGQNSNNCYGSCLSFGSRGSRGMLLFFLLHEAHLPSFESVFF